MSHHYSGPDFGFPRGDARLDFSDLFAFPSPATHSLQHMGDYFLAQLTNGKVTGVGVGPHTDLLEEFPYLGAPHGSYED